MIYDTIKKLCADKGISIYQLEKKANLTNGSISKWNRHEPSAISLKAVAQHLDVSVDDLLKDEVVKQEG